MTQSEILVNAPSPPPSTGRPWRRAFAGLAYVIIGVYIVAAVFGPLLLDYDPVATSVTDRLLAPGSETPSGTAWLGTDAVGRDVLAQVVYGARTSFVIGISVVLVCGV